MRVLVSAPYMAPIFSRFQPLFDALSVEVVLAEVKERLSEEQLLKHVGDLDGVICGDDQYTARVLDAASPRLKVISKWGTGIDSIDQEAAVSLGVQVCNTPGAFTQPVSDSVMQYILMFARRGMWLDREMKSGNWEKLPGRALDECTLGVVGVGRIGKAVLQRAKPFGMRMLGTDIVEIDPAFIGSVGVSMLPLHDLLAQSDYISINCDLNPSSHHLINATSLGWCKRGAVLINTARGPVVDEPALVQALQDGLLAGAALDVYEEEPLPAGSLLRRMDNVLLAPHNANSSPKAWERVHANTIRNLFAVLGLQPSTQDWAQVFNEPY